MLMKTQDIGYIMQKIQSEKKVNFYIQFCCKYISFFKFVYKYLYFHAEN